MAEHDEDKRAADNTEREKRESLPRKEDGEIERRNNQTETREEWRTSGRKAPGA